MGQIVGNADGRERLSLHTAYELFQSLDVVLVLKRLVFLLIVRNAGHTGNGADGQPV